jgi:hypothetical protein
VIFLLGFFLRISEDVGQIVMDLRGENCIHFSGDLKDFLGENIGDFLGENAYIVCPFPLEICISVVNRKKPFSLQ